MLIPQYAPLGSLKKPLCGLVLHYGNGGPNGLPSEASYIGVSQSEGIKTPKVNLYVPKSSLRTRTRAYKPLGGNITVSALLSVETELDAEAPVPLYMQIVMSILRELGKDFNLIKFQTKLDHSKRSFNPAQLAGLEQ
ncbi:hypothetical protein AX14_001766 [Amanita brunnescens Koide BX004]|nr:hypothetical protein AX14_001766 [Amanita brunnescens Koide BX004]